MATRIGLALIALYFLAIGCAGRQPTNNSTAQQIRRTLAEIDRSHQHCSTETIATGEIDLHVSLEAPMEGYYWITAYREPSTQSHRGDLLSFGTVYARARDRIDCHLPVQNGESVGLLAVSRLERSRYNEGYEGVPVHVTTVVRIDGREMTVNLDPCTWGACPIVVSN